MRRLMVCAGMVGLFFLPGLGGAGTTPVPDTALTPPGVTLRVVAPAGRLTAVSAGAAVITPPPITSPPTMSPPAAPEIIVTPNILPSWAERQRYHDAEYDRLRQIFAPPVPVHVRTDTLMTGGLGGVDVTIRAPSDLVNCPEVADCLPH